MFTDIKGFTSRTSSSSRSDMIDMLKTHDDMLTPVILEYGGTLIKTIGDAFLVTFESPTDAVLSGIALQEKLQKFNNSLPDNKKIEIRIAINTGEVSIKDNDVYGEAVNIAARVEGLADANQIFFTEATYLSMNKSEVPSAEIGYRLLKGIPDKIKVFKVLQDHNKQEVKTVESLPLDTGQSTVASAGDGIGKIRSAGVFKRFIAIAIDFLILFLLSGFILGKQHTQINLQREKFESRIAQKNLPKLKLKHVDEYPPELREEAMNILTAQRKISSSRWKLIPLVFVIYYTFSIWIWKTTIGKKILGLKVIDSSGRRPGFRQALLRTLLYFLSFYTAGLGFLWAVFSREHLTWHDKLSDTVVVFSKEKK